MQVTHRRIATPLPPETLDDERLRELAIWGRRLSDFGISPAASGNLSCRRGDRFLITGTGVPLGGILAHDWVEVSAVTPRDDGGLIVESRGLKEPSRDASVHAAIYGRLPEASAVFHLHPDYLNILSDDLGVPTTATYQTAGTVESVREIERWLDPAVGYLVIVDHGIVAWADSVEAAGRMVERYHHMAIRVGSDACE
jgi:ribulose-5-phosphate 4-epimerase/fuculose-1-phosphate aldolase